MGGMGSAILENLEKYKIQMFQKGYRGVLEGHCPGEFTSETPAWKFLK